MPTLIHIATIMPTFIRSFFTNLFLLFFHLGCFTISSLRHHSTSSILHKKRSPPNPKSTLFSYLKRLFFTPSTATHIPPPPPSIPSPSSSTRSLRLNPPLIAPINTRPHHHHIHTHAPADIHPCTVCGELFQTPASLHHHQSSNHGVSDLPDGDNVIRIIFTTGWPAKPPAIHRILKIHNTPRVVARFEDHRDRVKSDGTKSSRCAADGNELLRFYCTTFICSLDSAICSHQFCGACAIIRYGFSKKLSGIHTLPTGWKAHAAVPEDVEEEFSFMHVKRAMLVCRVIAGRVGSTLSDVDKDHAFDSLVGPGDDDLLVFSPKLQACGPVVTEEQPYAMLVPMKYFVLGLCYTQTESLCIAAGTTLSRKHGIETKTNQDSPLITKITALDSLPFVNWI